MPVPNEAVRRLLDRLAKENKEQPTTAVPGSGIKPSHIAQDCPKCGTPIVHADILGNLTSDEFFCPVCRDDIYLDWPEGKRETSHEGS